MGKCRFYKKCPQAGDDEICDQCDFDITCVLYQSLEEYEKKQSRYTFKLNQPYVKRRKKIDKIS